MADVNDRRLIVHRDPGAGRYRDVMAFAQLEQVAPLASPSCPLAVHAAFGDLLAEG